MRKIAFIIPGYNCSEKRKEYLTVAAFFKSRGIKPVLVAMDWKRKTFKDYTEQFMNCYEKHAGKNDAVYVLGFSFGAIIAVLVAGRIKLKEIILCSLSPFFKEDLPTTKQWWIQYWGKRRQQEFKQMSFEVMRLRKEQKMHTKKLQKAN